MEQFISLAKEKETENRETPTIAGIGRRIRWTFTLYMSESKWCGSPTNREPPTNMLCPILAYIYLLTPHCTQGEVVQRVSMCPKDGTASQA